MTSTKRCLFLVHHKLYRLRLKSAPSKGSWAMEWQPLLSWPGLDTVASQMAVFLFYLHDIVIHSRNVEKHLEHIRTFLGLLSEWNILLKSNKCFFHQDHAEYLGHLIPPGRVAISMKETGVIRGVHHLRNWNELKKFLSSCNVCRRVLPTFGYKAAHWAVSGNEIVFWLRRTKIDWNAGAGKSNNTCSNCRHWYAQTKRKLQVWPKSVCQATWTRLTSRPAQWSSEPSMFPVMTAISGC